MIGGNKTPFRASCGSGGPALFLGNPFNHRSPSDAPVAVYLNTTKMKDHCGNSIDPKPLLEPLNTCGFEVCSSGCNDCPGGMDLTINTGPGPLPADNTFTNSGTVNLTPARKLGFKNLQAFKYWQGAFDFLTDPGTGKDCATSTTHSQTRYRSRIMSASIFYDDGDEDPGAGVFVNTITMDRTITVDQYSGIRSLSGCSDTHATDYAIASYQSFPRADLVADVSCLNEVPSVVEWLASCDPSTIVSGPGGSSGNSTNPDTGFVAITVTSVRTATSYTWAIDRYILPGPGVVNTHIEHYTGSITLADPYTIGDVYADAIAQAGEWLLDDDIKYPFRTEHHMTIAPIILRDEAAQFTIDLLPPCQVDDYTAPITNDTGDAPFSSGWVASQKWSQRDWFDPNGYHWVFPAGMDNTNSAATGLVALYSGGILGAPLPAGYGQADGTHHYGVFDGSHLNYYRRNCTGGAGWTTADESVGAYTAAFLPGNTTKQTTDFNATHLWPCAFVNADISGVYLQKWSEVQIKRPSVNFARPFGADKYVYDETTVFYVSSFTSGVVTLFDNTFSTPGSPPFTTSDIVGGTSVGGFFTVTAVGTNTVTLGPLVHAVPSTWTSPSGDDAKCFGKLRWPNAPGMDFTDPSAEVGGRVALAAVTNGTPVTLTTATTQNYLSITAAENIDIYDATMTLLASNVAATRVDATHFTVPTSYLTITTGKWITPHGAKYKFGDNRSKGDYVFRTWLVNIDDSSVVSHSQTDECLTFRPCSPNVAMITPNGETPTNGNSHGFPGSVANGQVWLGQVQFWMVDPFWQTPHVPVAASGYVGGTDIMTWTMDNGGCEADTEEAGSGENIFRKFYPMNPFVEARCTLPSITGDTPPAPPVDITAFSDPVGQVFISDVDGPLIDAINLPTPVWMIYAAQQACVNASGRFAADYHANGT